MFGSFRSSLNRRTSGRELGFPRVGREFPTVLDLIGRTPVVRLDRVGRDVPGTLLAKLEFLNPGGSNKDRIGIAMVEAAERDGRLRPGGTIVEPTSGNTGVGLAMAAARKGYRCVFVMPDKMSQEKISMLRAYGAEVVITPTAVDHDSPESYYSVSSRLAEEIPGGFKPDQYSNSANPEAHYRTTAPEIWEQTDEGQLDAIVISVGTGGTISGIGRWFHERRPEVRVVGVDPEGSIYTARGEDDLHPYLVEGIGKDTWPDTIDLTVVDEWIRVSDRDSFLTARRLAREEGLLVGGSSGSTVWAALEYARRLGKPDARILTILPDSGRSYLSKFLDDNWMIEHGFLERAAPAPTVRELLRAKQGETPRLVTIAAHQKVAEAIDVMERYSISQLPVVRNGEVSSLADVIGSLQDRALLDRVFKNADALHEDVAAAMQGPLATVEADASIDDIVTALTGGTNAVVVADGGRPVGVVTRSDVLDYLAHAT
jgi:cystathionine beta-synthase